MTIEVVQWNNIQDWPGTTVVTFQRHKSNNLDDADFAKIRQTNTFQVHNGIWFRDPRIFPPYLPDGASVDSVRLRTLQRYGGEGPLPGVISQYHFTGWRNGPTDEWTVLMQGEEGLPKSRSPQEDWWPITPTGDLNDIEMLVTYTLNWTGAGAPNPAGT